MILFFLFYFMILCSSSVLIKEKIDLKKILLTFIFSLISIIFQNFFNFLLFQYFLFFLFLKILYKKSFYQTFLLYFFLLILSMITEIIISSIFVFFQKGKIIFQFMIPVCFFFISNTKIIKKIFRNLYEKKVPSVVFILFLFFLIFFMVSKNIESQILFVVLFSILAFQILKEYSFYISYEQKYDILLKQLEVSEQMFKRYKLNQHAALNELSLIRSLIDCDQKEALQYVDQLIEKERLEHSDLLLKIEHLPKGGLVGILYQKLLDFEKKEIRVCLEIDGKVNSSSLEGVDQKPFLMIVHLFIEQSFQNIESDNVSMHFFIEDDYFHFQIAYLSKNKDYSIKKYIKNILRENNNLKIRKELIDDLYSETISIKMTK